MAEWLLQPLCHSHSATQPLRRSGKSGWSSHSATQSLRVAEWLSGCTKPLWQSGRVAGAATLADALVRVAGPATQPLSHSATQPLRRSGKSGWSSHSGRVAEWLSGWSSHSGRVAEWLSGCFDFASRVAHPLFFLACPDHVMVDG